MSYWKSVSIIGSKDVMDHLLEGRDVLKISYAEYSSFDEDEEYGCGWSVSSLRNMPLAGIQDAIKRNKPSDIFVLLS